jgi:hypothetical protein
VSFCGDCTHDVWRDVRGARDWTVDRPMFDQALAEKFLKNATPVVGRDRAAQLVEMAATLEGLGDFGQLVRACALTIVAVAGPVSS